MSDQTQIRQNITNRIVEALEKNIIPWRKPWSNDPNSGLPVNFVSKKLYTGINVLLLELTAMEKNYSSKFWGTYKQWAEIGGQVRKGEKSTMIVFYKVLNFKEENKKTRQVEEKKIFLLRPYFVFNLSQVDGDNDKINKLRPMQTPPIVSPDWQKAEDIIAATKAKIRYGGNKAFYRLPSTYSHDDKRSYAMGELVAEIGSVFLSNALGLPQNDDLTNHTAYIKTWIKSMNNDPKFIFQASSWATKATDYILNPEKKMKFDDGDYIQMPNRNQFVNLTDFYATTFHELCHFSELRTGFLKEI